MNTLVTCILLPAPEYVCSDEDGKTKGLNYNPLVSSVLYFASLQGNMHPMMGVCSSGREISSSNVMGLFLADGTATGVRCFCTHQ
jgi:hypothetical protein